MNKTEIQKQLADYIIGLDALTSESSNRCAAEAIKFLQSRFYIVPKGEVEVVGDEIKEGDLVYTYEEREKYETKGFHVILKNTKWGKNYFVNDTGCTFFDTIKCIARNSKPPLNKSIILEE